jgi:hypothetical protein
MELDVGGVNLLNALLRKRQPRKELVQQDYVGLKRELGRMPSYLEYHLHAGVDSRLVSALRDRGYADGEVERQRGGACGSGWSWWNRSRRLRRSCCMRGHGKLRCIGCMGILSGGGKDFPLRVWSEWCMIKIIEREPR